MDTPLVGADWNRIQDVEYTTPVIDNERFRICPLVFNARFAKLPPCSPTQPTSASAASAAPSLRHECDVIPDLHSRLSRLPASLGQSRRFWNTGLLPQVSQQALEHQTVCQAISDPVVVPSEQSGPYSNMKFGPFEAVKSLGRGGQAHTFLATDGSRNAAVKLFHTTNERAEREVRALGALAGVQGVPTLIDHHLTESDSWVAMEFIEGVSLHDHVTGLTGSEQAVHDSRMKELARSTASVLAAVHQAGVVHRDITPRNLIIDLHGNGWLVDFGLGIDSQNHSKTSFVDLAGTPTFISPEVERNGLRAADSKADVFGLASCIFFGLYGGNGVHSRKMAALDPRISKVWLAAISDDPHERPDAAALVDFDLFDEYVLTARSTDWMKQHEDVATLVDLEDLGSAYRRAGVIKDRFWHDRSLLVISRDLAARGEIRKSVEVLDDCQIGYWQATGLSALAIRLLEGSLADESKMIALLARSVAKSISSPILRDFSVEVVDERLGAAGL